MSVSQPLLEQEFIEMNIDKLVVGVPVRFNAAQRGEIESIVKEAIGGKSVRLAPEADLAAICNDYFMKRNGRKTERPILVYDMGAGTFDTVILQPNPNPSIDNPYPYISFNPNGSTIAGDLIDEMMEELIMDKIKANPGQLNLTILENKNHEDRIKLRTQTAKKVKEQLSDLDEVFFQVTGLECGVSMYCITREEFENKIRVQIQKTIDMAAEVAKQSGVWNNPNLDILLVGGSTYIPLIRKLLLTKFHWLDEKHIQQRYPEKAVALGAAIYAAQPEIVLPKVAYGYAVRTYSIEKQKSMLSVTIPSNAKLPMTVKNTYYTRYETQKDVTFRIFEVEHGEQAELLEIHEGTQLNDKGQEYELKHNFNQEVFKGTRVDLITTLNEDGLLTMTVDDLGITPFTTKTFTLTGIKELK